MSMLSRLFKKPESELDRIIDEIKVNLENNYKSVAHAARERLGTRTEELFSLGKINEDKYRYYKRIYEEYTQKMRNYHH